MYLPCTKSGGMTRGFPWRQTDRLLVRSYVQNSMEKKLEDNQHRLKDKKKERRRRTMNFLSIIVFNATSLNFLDERVRTLGDRHLHI